MDLLLTSEQIDSIAEIIKLQCGNEILPVDVFDELCLSLFEDIAGFELGVSDADQKKLMDAIYKAM